MKTIFTLFICSILYSYTIYAQVGIGTVTVDDSAILDISGTSEGLLVPKLDNAQRAVISNPAYGLTIFNTDSGTLEYNIGTPMSPNWVSVNTEATATSNTRQSAKYSNTTTTTNINGATVINAPIFGTEEWNDNSTLYTVAANALTVNETGRYKINVNLSILSNSGAARKSPEAYLAIDGTQAGAYASTGYMRRANNHETSSLHINEVLNLTAGNIVTIKIVRGANSNTAVFNTSGASNFYIEKID